MPIAPNRVIPRISEEEIRTLVFDMVQGRVFTSAHIRNREDIRMVFMPLCFGGFADWSHEELAQIGLIYEYLEKAGPRECNGLPSFFSMNVLHTDDTKIVLERYETAMNALKTSIEGGTGTRVPAISALASAQNADIRSGVEKSPENCEGKPE